MPTFNAITLCLGLQFFLGSSIVHGLPTFGSLSFPNMLAVNASASATASANASSQSTLTAGAHANATAGTSIGQSGALTMPGLSPPSDSKGCICQESSSTQDTMTPPPVNSGGSNAKPSDAPPTELKSTSPDTSNSSSVPPAETGADNKSSTPDTPAPTSGASAMISDFTAVVPVAISLLGAVGLLFA
ncbi:hypothetical protein DFH28DRAFT_17209 [Melampsora americana]|nr:hypothetical protein DFH28DRAFT_17209 [Melampsora americana]